MSNKPNSGDTAGRTRKIHIKEIDGRDHVNVLGRYYDVEYMAEQFGTNDVVAIHDEIASWTKDHKPCK